MIILWPVGTPVLYAVLLWASRSAHETGITTPLSRVRTLLSGDYTDMWFWWDIAEMTRKLVLT
eukprot:2646874-Prymnesium_polylepis.1